MSLLHTYYTSRVECAKCQTSSTGVSHFTCDLRWAAGADKLTVNRPMHAMHNFTVLMSCSLPNF